MSLTAIPFAINITKVKSIFGSQDHELLEKIKTANLYNHYATQGPSLLQYNKYNFDQALEDIIFNYIKPELRELKSSFLPLKKSITTSGLNEIIAHSYGYALLVVCDYLGTHLTPQCDALSYGRDFDAAMNVMKEHGLRLDLSDMFNDHDVFDIPKSGDSPTIKHFTQGEIDHINSVMNKVEIDESKIDFESEDFDEVQQMLYYIHKCFKTCSNQNIEMVTFAH